MPIINVENIWKRYRIPHQRRMGISDNLTRLGAILQTNKYTYEEFWALKEISLGLERGDSLGVVGPNGSGKSTLLKLMARVIRPDKGRIETEGSIVSILELGIGFHGDLTVEENATVYGVIMGLGRSEMKKRIVPILDFAGLTRFRDAKLGSLSSGMQVRLAFSITVQTEADIFLVDEALAVGDIEFQQRCTDRFLELKKEKKSIVLVSHNMNLIRSFCEKTLYLLNGEKKAFGPSEQATDTYLEDVISSMKS